MIAIARVAVNHDGRGGIAPKLANLQLGLMSILRLFLALLVS